MIEIDKKQVTLEFIATEFNIPLAKIRKAPVFEINPTFRVKDVLNGGFKVPVGTAFDAVFFAKNPKTGKTHEFRFILAKGNDRVGDKLIDTYEPRKVVFRGDAALKSDIDEAVYFYLHPKNRTSPFRSPKTTKPWRYDFIDNEARSNAVIDSIKILSGALSHATGLTGKMLKIMAKGLEIAGVDAMEPSQVTAALLLKAKSNPELYMERVNRSNEVVFKGIIQDAIDKNLIICKEKMGLKSWIWNAGKNKGEKIVDVLGNNVDQNLILFNHINANIESFYTPITQLADEVTSVENASAFLSGKKINLGEEARPISTVNVEEQVEKRYQQQIQHEEDLNSNNEEPLSEEDDNGPGLMDDDDIPEDFKQASAEKKRGGPGRTPNPR